MIDDRDIWRSARTMIDHHQADAAIHAAMRADELLASGDLDGCRVSTRIVKAIDALAEARLGPHEMVGRAGSLHRALRDHSGSGREFCQRGSSPAGV